jgi:3-oxoacyl-[acyl-carrier protein] reductase
VAESIPEPSSRPPRRQSSAPTGRRRALVTGATGDLGRAIAHRLARDGAHVIVHAHSRPDAGRELAAALVAAGGSAEAIVFDVTDRAAAEAALEAALAGGPVQVLINNAGIHDDAVFPAMRPEQWDRVIDVSLNGFFNVTRPLLLPMIRTRWGRIINIGSVAGVLGNRGQVNYAAAKGALHSAAKALSLEVAGRGITVNAVAPGIIASAMAAGAFPPDLIARLVPVGRAGTADEVAALVAFLVGDEAAYISGQVISINGGMA